MEKTGRTQNTVRVSFWTFFAGWQGFTPTDPAGEVSQWASIFSLSVLFYASFNVFYNPSSYSLREGKEGLLTKTRRRLMEIIRVCFFEAGRSIAHKCSRFLALCIR